MTAIKFKIDEYVHGQRKFPTPCPYGEISPYIKELIGVGSIACERCDYFKSKHNNIVNCKYVPILQKEKKDNKPWPWRR